MPTPTYPQPAASTLSPQPIAGDECQVHRAGQLSPDRSITAPTQYKYIPSIADTNDLRFAAEGGKTHTHTYIQLGLTHTQACTHTPSLRTATAAAQQQCCNPPASEHCSAASTVQQAKVPPCTLLLPLPATPCAEPCQLPAAPSHA